MGEDEANRMVYEAPSGNHGNCVVLRSFALLRQPGKSRKANKPELRLQAIALHSGRMLYNR
jgi:hypothetical protein